MMKYISAVLLVMMISAGLYTTGIHAEDDSDKDIVVLLHGLARSSVAMWLLDTRLQNAGYKVELIGYSSLNKTPEEIVENITEQINECCKDSDRKINFVGHSLGGLLIRAYLQDNQVKNLGRVVLIGTPNHGTELVDHFRDRWWASIAGPTTSALGTDDDSFPKSLNDPYYPVGVIAGYKETIENDEYLPGKDDGLVPVKSTKVSGMSDFILIETGHSFMRYDENVAIQTIAFLRDGKFSTDEVIEAPE